MNKKVGEKQTPLGKKVTKVGKKVTKVGEKVNFVGEKKIHRQTGQGLCYTLTSCKVAPFIGTVGPCGLYHRYICKAAGQTSLNLLCFSLPPSSRMVGRGPTGPWIKLRKISILYVSLQFCCSQGAAELLHLTCSSQEGSEDLAQPRNSLPQSQSVSPV